MVESVLQLLGTPAVGFEAYYYAWACAVAGVAMILVLLMVGRIFGVAMGGLSRWWR